VPRKPDLKLRQPSNNHIQAFVHSGSSDARTSRRLESQDSKRLDRKQVTLYLAPDLVKKLKFQSVNTGMQMSDITAEALKKHLG